MIPENKMPLNIIKEFVDFLFISKMTVLFTKYPSIDIEYTNVGEYKVSLSYVDYQVYNFKNYEDVLSFFNNLNYPISRIQISNGKITKILYGDFYYYELQYYDSISKVVRYPEMTQCVLSGYLL
jgi:hypothetical protein